MARYVALLRGVNLGARNRVSMPDLRAALAGRGFDDVATYVQSGNVVLSSAQRAPAVAREIERCLAEDLGVEAQVVVRTPKELAAVIEDDPLADVADDPAKHFIVFLSKAPPKAEARRLGALDVAPERVAVGRREVYLWCPNGLRNSKLGRLSLDERLGVTATMRNARTTAKLLELAG